MRRILIFAGSWFNALSNRWIDFSYSPKVTNDKALLDNAYEFSGSMSSTASKHEIDFAKDVVKNNVFSQNEDKMYSSEYIMNKFHVDNY